ncbi:MAG TPA: hypothetical protein VLA93_17515 [Pyrinomonadaceae bacterium]|nr:hypothetical protein [Pyrinomonadaceae bacterium]
MRGKYAVNEVEFAQLVKLTIACIGEDEGLRFKHHSPGNSLAGRKAGDWTYEIDNANQVTLRYWRNEFRSVAEPISNPPVITNSQELSELQHSLRKHVLVLKDSVDF